MPWLSHTFLLVHPKYHVEKLSITSHRAGKCAALETFYDKSLWKSCSLVVKALMCANNWLTTVSFLWRSKLCTLWCCVMSSKKANLSDIWQSVRAVKFPSSEKKGKEKKKLQCGSPTEPPHSFVIYSIFIFSLNVKQDLRKLGVVHGFGKIEINGLHPTFHNIIKSEMFWTKNLLLDYKVSLIVLPPSSLTLLQTTASKSSVTFMSWSTFLRKISNWTVSDTSLLPSQANEKIIKITTLVHQLSFNI